MVRKLIIPVVIGAVLIVGAVFLYPQAASELSDNSAAKQDYTVLDASLSEFISDFNVAKGSTRLVFVAGPSCGPCLRGLTDMNNAVGDMTRENPDLKTFIVYVPTLGAEEKHAARAVRLMEGKDILHYWDPEGTSGLAIQQALDLQVYAWDVWLIYDGTAEWSAGNPPAPVHWEHQLRGLGDDNKLNPDRFAAKVIEVRTGGSENG